MDAREETELVIFSAMDSLLDQMMISPQDIDIVIVNCILFNSTPSILSMVIHKYSMRSNMKSYNLSGMGCSAGLISIDLAKHLLQVHLESNTVIISTEIITPNSYRGNERSMFVPNILFRMGGAAILLTNKRSLRKHVKYSLLHVVRTHKGAEDKSYGCVMQEEDKDGHVGVALQMDLMVEQETIHSRLQKGLRSFCIHAGGWVIIDEVQKNLKLSDEHVEASRMTLYRFGNTSSSSVWYEIGYIEAKGRMIKGNSVWQIRFGSGFNRNSVVWKCNREIEFPKTGAWADSIHRYPVFVPEVVKF
ncbi:hypothetical protein L2E82_08351 [Cichorium intybus]|uniref:Uncharacterized protein n=1 Tax=Cichorium intybus TaxID=13427 RepID=A0ACB9G7E4_CICIN|nr:hypothetical protein L2E82_08351 [Cichorium intybus]